MDLLSYSSNKIIITIIVLCSLLFRRSRRRAWGYRMDKIKRDNLYAVCY